MPLAYGNTVLESTEIDLSFGVLGNVHFTSALIVDVGVYLLVVAVVLDLVTALGGQVDKDRAEAEQAQVKDKMLAGSISDVRREPK